MKVLQINNKFKGTGAENVMKMLGRGLSEKGCEVHYATYEDVALPHVHRIKCLPEYVMGALAKVTSIKGKGTTLQISDPNESLMKRVSINFRNIIPLEDPLTIRSMETLIDSNRPDIIHCHNILPSLAPVTIAKKNDIPVVLTLHGYWLACPLGNRMQRSTKQMCYHNDFTHCNFSCASSFVNVRRYMEKMQRIIIDNVDALVPVSHYVGEVLKDSGYPPGMITTIHNGVDLQKFRPKDMDIKPRVLHVGRLSTHKGSHIVLKVARQMELEYPQIKFTLVGSGIGENVNFPGNVEYPGWVSEETLIEMYSHSLCGLLPSQWPEPHGLTILETMACGTPMIGSNISGISESIIDGFTGFLVDIASEELQVKRICECIKILYEDTELRLRMGEMARKNVEKHFDMHRMVDYYLKLYRSF